jgi:hypothetical protein
MRKLNILGAAGFFVILVAMAIAASAAYQHAGEADKDPKIFLNVYPDKAGTKLDNCALCHSGGVYTSGGKSTTMGSCQYCHAITGYGKDTTQYINTLNPYGRDYLNNGRSEAALKAIESLDSDGDGFSNIVEINATTYPGDPNDDPTKVVAPYRIYSKTQLQALLQHSQFLLMNTTKSGDYYATYSGVIMQDLLKKVGITADATQITVYAPDGFSQRHPLGDSSSNVGKAYAPYVNGTYPPATYYYNKQADTVNGGWCNYSSAGTAGRKHGDPINVDGGLRLILALQRDGKDLVPGYLDAGNKLGGEGPFRVVTPQKIVGPPDQSSTFKNATSSTAWVWPYDPNADHNAGFASKSATIIKVEPLPAGTTDINVLEAGWGYIDKEKIVIYGALQGSTLVSPVDGANNVPRRGAILTWTKTVDTDPSAAITYTVQLSKDKVTWTTLTTKVASAAKMSGTFFAGTGKYFLFIGIIGMISVGVSRRTRKFLGIFLMIAATGAVISSCGGGGGGAGSPSSTVSTAITQTLDPNTTYYWKVTGDGPNSHLISAVSSFTTGRW